MEELLFQTAAAALGSLAFGIVYQNKAVRLLEVAVGGGIGWFLYCMVYGFTKNVFLGNMAASIFAAVYAEYMAKSRRAPVTVFLLPCLIPLVPGGSLYYTLSFTVLKEFSKASPYLQSTLEAAFGIAAGVIVVSVFLGQHRKEADRLLEKLHLI